MSKLKKKLARLKEVQIIQPIKFLPAQHFFFSPFCSFLFIKLPTHVRDTMFTTTTIATSISAAQNQPKPKTSSLSQRNRRSLVVTNVTKVCNNEEERSSFSNSSFPNPFC